MPQGRADTPTVTIDPEEPPAGPWRLVIHSLGDASAALIPALRHVSPLAPSQLASLLYRAPSILAEGLSREVADSMTELLRRTGVEVSPLHEEEPFEPGEGVFDLALSVGDPARLGEVASLICELLGCSLEEGRKMACASPALLMGGVSEATVSAFERRFSALGATLDVSRPEAALYDLFIGETAPAARAAVVGMLRDAGLEGVSDEGPLLAAGLDWPAADGVWPSLQRLAAPVRLLNRDFQRFDVRLDRAEGSEALFDYLTDSTGMPRAVAERLPEKAPLVLFDGVPHAEAMTAVARLAELGADASAQLLAFERFVVELPAAVDPARTARVLRAAGGLSAEQASAVVAAGGVLPEPFGKAQAFWLRAELQRIGVEAKVGRR